MFDIGFSELLLFGIIALIVLGPEKLPQAARTAGQWYAKLRRTVSSLQSEIEAELDLAETRKMMQDEIARIRQTEAQMKREMAEMRGSMQEFEQSQNQSLNAKHQPSTSQEDKKAVSTEFAYAYHQDQKTDSATNNADLNKKEDSDVQSSDSMVQPILTRPWENMWFRLGAYDKARRLPAPPFLPNYQADILLNADLNKKMPDTPSSLQQQEADK